MAEEKASHQAPASSQTSSFTAEEAAAPVLSRSKDNVVSGATEAAVPEDKEGELNVLDGWEHDPANGRNWSPAKKWTAASIVSLYTFIPPLASSMMAPGLPQVARKYHITNESLLSLTLSIFLLSFAIGPLFLAPLSEIYGRNKILHIANICSIGFSLGCAFAPDTSSLIGLRFLAGFSGSAPIAIGPGTVGDLFAEKDRASAMALYSLGPLIGPAIGPIAGGFIAQYADVKYVFIVIAALGGIGSLVGIPFLKETYAPVIQYSIAKKAGNTEKMVRLRRIQMGGAKNTAAYIWVNISRPFIYLARSLVCFLFALYLAILYGIYYLMFTTFAAFFGSTYGFSPGMGGLTYLGLGTGLFIATAFGARFADKIYQVLSDRNGGKGKPEFRIPALAPGSIAAPVGLLWYGWSAAAKLHWIMPIIGTGIFGFGFMTSFLPMQLYLVDSFQYAASVSASTAVFRSMLGFVFPLFGQQMFDALGIGPGNTLLAGVAILLGIPFPFFIYLKGEKMRARNPYTRHSVYPSPAQ
jgi:MFS family permease